MIRSNSKIILSRRDVLKGTAAVATAASVSRSAFAAAPKFKRWSLSDPAIPARVLDSYKKAIRAMLKLPPTDPRNWYRYALIYTIDCPHGNWWFLPWHRGYIGWFEQICRDLSSDPDFALPYWDWTKEPRVPREMFDDVLDPTNNLFIPSKEDFRAKFTDAIANAGYWSVDRTGNPTPQYTELLVRSIRFPQDLWFDALDSPAGPMFFDLAHARGLTATAPELLVPNVPPDKQPVMKAVSKATILQALKPSDFVSFASPKAFAHSTTVGFSPLENQPHNLVHNCVGGAYNNMGGFMQAFMSPVDPIFFLHHTNIDRLWDVWTRKQRARNMPVAPSGDPNDPNSDYSLWASEPFVFYIGSDGKPATKAMAGDYAEIGDFNYEYSPGTGDEVIPIGGVPPLAPEIVAHASMLSTRVTAENAASGSVVVPSNLLGAAQQDQGNLFATLTVKFPPGRHGDLDVFVDAGGSSQFAGTLSMFGHHILTAPVTFTVPVSTPLATLSKAKPIGENEAVTIQVSPSAGMGAMAGHGMNIAGERASEVISITIHP